MNSRAIHIVEFPSNLGLKETVAGIEPGVRNLPDWLRELGFHSQIHPDRVSRLDPPVYSVDIDPDSGVRNADKISEYAVDQCKLLLPAFEEGVFQLILGGDCSVLIGTALALKQKGAFGLFFLDGHTDFILPEQSLTGGAAGMDLAIVTGHGHDKLTNILSLKPYFREEDVFCVGNREYDEDYVKPVLESDILYFDLKALRENGIEHTAHQFLKMVDTKGLDGFFMHIDVDVLDDRIMPAVDSRAGDGLSYHEFAKLLKPLISSRKAVGAEITILDPSLDRDGRYTREFIRNFVEILRWAQEIHMT